MIHKWYIFLGLLVLASVYLLNVMYVMNKSSHLNADLKKVFFNDDNSETRDDRELLELIHRGIQR